MTDSMRQADALLTEHFRYTPLTLIDDIINAVNTIVYRGIEAIESGLLNIPPKTLGFKRDQSFSGAPDGDPYADGNSEYPEAQAEIENGVHQLETLLESTVDKAFDKFEIYTLRNILTVPDDLAPWMRLAHYENLPLPLPPTAPTPESILHLRRQLQETRKLHLALRATHTRNAAVLAQLHTLLTPTKPPHPASLSFLASPPTSSSTPATTDPLPLSFAPNANTLQTHAQFAISQLPALRALVAELRPRVQGVRDAWAGAGEGQSRREERRGYIERGVRRVVGVGGGDVEGRRGGEEVEGLEGIVGGLGR